MKKPTSGPGVRWNTPATGNRPVIVHEQKATAADLAPKKSKRRKRRSK